MDIRQLRYYVEIVDQQNISKAADVLNIAQPPLSQLLKKLETELGTTLIHRYRQKWELTETGTLLYQYAEQTLKQMNEVKKRIQEIEQGTAGTVRIGVSSACSNILLDYVSAFREQSPQIKIDITINDSESLIVQLKQKEIDIALLLKPSQTEQFVVKPLKQEPAVLIVPNQWTEKLSTEPTLEELADFPFVMLGAMEGHYFYEEILNTFAAQDLMLNIVIECKDIPMVTGLVNRGAGISIIPRMHYQSLHFENLTVYEFKQFNLGVEPVLMTLAELPISKAARQFWKMVS